MPEYPPFRVWMQTTQDITGESYTHIGTERFTGADGEGVVLPLDAAQIDDAAVEVMAQELTLTRWEVLVEPERNHFRRRARAALAALLAHLAEVDRG